MAFNSISFFVFFSIVFCINYILKQNYRKYFLILSCFFFIAFNNYESLLILLFSIILTFYLAKNIEIAENQRKKKVLFRIGVFSSLLILLLFKHLESGNGISILTSHFKSENILYSLGISFYTLQNISYLFDIYYKRIQLEKSIINFTLYSSFFPKFIIGPITRTNDFLPQFESNTVNKKNILLGAQRILLGLVKKIVIADRLSTYVHFNFDINEPTTGLTSVIAVYLFTLQLYFDFTGYIDIALGSSKMLGFDLKENFNLPLRATSITDFWRRWHISLTSWITDYVFYPLSFKYRKYKRAGISLALLITFIVSGIWHGIGYTFILYSLLHAYYMCFELYTVAIRERIAKLFPSRIYHYLSIFITFNLVSLSFVFFRSISLDKSILYLKSIFNPSTFLPTNWYLDLYSKIATGGDQKHFFNLAVSLIVCSIFVLYEKSIFRTTVTEKLNIKPVITLLLLLLLFGAFTVQEQFIYNQF